MSTEDELAKLSVELQGMCDRLRADLVAFEERLAKISCGCPASVEEPGGVSMSYERSNRNT